MAAKGILRKGGAKTKTKAIQLKPNSKFQRALQKAEVEPAVLEVLSSDRTPAALVAREAEEKTSQKVQRVLAAIHATISSIPYHAAPAAGVTLHPAALTSKDAHGFPSTRTVVPAAVAADLSEVKISTRKGTRKEAEIRADDRVALHFQDQRGRGGWVTLKGRALVRSGAQEGMLDIVLKPTTCEAMSYVEAELLVDSEGFTPVSLTRKGDEWELAVA